MMLQARFRAEVESVLRVLFMFVPLPLFHALFDQQVSVKTHSHQARVRPSTPDYTHRRPSARVDSRRRT